MKSVFLVIAAVLFSASVVSAQDLPPVHVAEVGCTISAHAPEWPVDTNLSEFKYVVNAGLNNETYISFNSEIKAKSATSTFEATCSELFGDVPIKSTLGVRAVGINGEESAVRWFSVDMINPPEPVPAAAAEVCLDGTLVAEAVMSCQVYP